MLILQIDRVVQKGLNLVYIIAAHVHMSCALDSREAIYNNSTLKCMSTRITINKDFVHFHFFSYS